MYEEKKKLILFMSKAKSCLLSSDVAAVPQERRASRAWLSDGRELRQHPAVPSWQVPWLLLLLCPQLWVTASCCAVFREWEILLRLIV